MKYRIENKLNLFSFHDAEFSFVSFDKSEFIVSAKHLNIHKDIPENPNNWDMEIDYARIIFTKFEMVSFEPMRAYQADDDGNWYTDEPQIIYKGKEAEKHFLNEIKKGITINCIDICEKENKNYIELSTCAQTCFFAAFAFDSVVVEWDEYCKKAWYELHKQYKYEITLMTPIGEEKTEVNIVCHEEDMYYQGKLEKAPIVNVGIKYEDKEFWGHGKDYLWVDAFADLQKQLPDGVIIKCCLSCRHGNLCPYGNRPGELFCTKDLIINSKEDMCNLFDNSETHAIYERTKNITDSCSEYSLQSDDYYTYNDYLYHLRK